MVEKKLSAHQCSHAKQLPTQTSTNGLALCKGPSYNEFRTDYSLTLYFHLLSRESFIESFICLIVAVSV